MNEHFSYISYAQQVIFSPGAVSQAGEAAGRFGWKRLLLCTNRSLRESGQAAELEAALGDCLKVTYDHVLPHVQDVQVDEVVALANEYQVDAVLGLGGGSPIGMAKAAAFTLAEKRGSHLASEALPVEQPLVPVMAIPTTYAGSEMTATFGITHSREAPPRKITVSHPTVAPKLVLYDPRLTLDLPPEMTASTGINALAHCIEALYSITRYPLSTAAAVSGVQHIYHSLLACFQHGDDLSARTEMLLGAHLAGYSLSNVSMGLHHGICHVLGGSANVPHGIANSIMLPHAIRFNADATANLLAPGAEAMGISASGRTKVERIEEMAQQIYHLVGQIGLPQQLRDVGVRESDLPGLAQLGFQNHTIQKNPKPITDVSQIEELLKEAW